MVSVGNSSNSAKSMKTDGSSPQYFADSTKGNIKEAYHFERKLANGGFGIVYLAEHRQTKQQFAVKAIQKKKLKDYTTFINEINILKVLDHPNIIKLHEIWEWNEVCFLVLEYCDGGELFHYILDKKHLSEAEAAMIMKQLFSALVYVHSMNISHRDIKPENFMLAK
jgi:calcium-dependent protein kinase